MTKQKHVLAAKMTFSVDRHLHANFSKGYQIGDTSSIYRAALSLKLFKRV
jgi:hypothetical protein